MISDIHTRQRQRSDYDCSAGAEHSTSVRYRNKIQQFPSNSPVHSRARQTEAEVKKLKTVVRAEATARRKAEEKAKAEATVRRQLEAKLEAEATARRRALPVIRTHTYGHRRCGAAGSREGMANRVCTRKGMSAIYQW